jgi:hypothetical protein
MARSLKALALTGAGRLQEAQQAWLVAALEEIGELHGKKRIDPDDTLFGEAIYCLLAARRPLLRKEALRRLVAKVMEVRPVRES